MGEPRAVPAFGELDLDLGLEEDDAVTPAQGSPPVRTARRSPVPAHDDATRVVQGDVLSNITRPPPAMAVEPASGAEEAPPSSRTRQSPTPAEAGASSHEESVTAMRELYLQGDEAGALALASMLNDSLIAEAGFPTRERPRFLPEGESSIDLSDPFEGLLPSEIERISGASTARPAAGPTTVLPDALEEPASPHLSLTARHSIPRVLKSLAELSKLPIDHRAGFLLAHVDGMQTLEEILDVCAMPASEALELIGKLEGMGVIEFE